MLSGHGIRRLRRFSRLMIILLIFCALISATALILFPLNRALLGAMAGIRDDFIASAEEYTGYELKYASLGPSVFNTFDLRNFSMVREDGSVFLSVSRLELSYSFAALLQGNSSGVIRSARLDGPRLNLDMEKDAALVKLLTSANVETEKPVLPDVISEDISIRLRNGECALILGNTNLDIRNVSIDVSVRHGTVNFQGRWNALGNIGLQGILSPDSSELTAVMAGRVSGEYSKGNGRAEISIPSFSGDSFRLRPLSFNVILKDSMLEMQKIYDQSPSSISLYWDIEENNIRASFSGENFSPLDLFSFSGSHSNQNSWLEARLSGRAIFEKQGENEPFYSLNLWGLFLEDSPLGRGNFTLLADGDTKKIEFQECALNISQGRVSYRGELELLPVSLNGLFSISEFGLHGKRDERISVDLEVTSTNDEMTISGTNLVAGNLTLKDMGATIIRDESGFAFDFSAFKIEDSESGGQKIVSSILFGGSMEYDPQNIWADIRINSFSARDILYLVQPFSSSEFVPGTFVDVLDNLSVTTEVFFSTDFDHVLFNAPGFIVQFNESREPLMRASLSGNRERFEINDAHFVVSGKPVDISVITEYSNPNNISFSTTLLYDDIAYYLDGSFLDRSSVIINGSYGLRAYLSTAGVNSWSGYAQADHVPVPGTEQPAQMSFLVSLRYDTPDFWHSAIEYFTMENTSVNGTQAILRFSGDADQDGLVISNITYSDGRGALTGELNLFWDADYSDFFLSAMMLDPQREELYELSASYESAGFENSSLNLFFSGERMQIGRIFGPDNAVASGNLTVNWESLNNFRVESEINALSFLYNGRETRVSVKAALDSDEFMLSDLYLRYNELEVLSPFARMDRQAGLAAAIGEIRGNLEGSRVDFEFRAGAEFAAINTWFSIRDLLDSFEGTVTMDRAHFATYEADEPFNFAFSSRKNETGYQVNFNGGPRNMLRFIYSSIENTDGGNFYAALSSPFPVRGSLTGYIDSRTIDANTTDLYVDLASLWNVVPFMKGVAFPGGILNASIRIAGPIREPDFYGVVRASSMKIQVPQFIPEDIRPVPANIYMNGNEMTFGPIEASVGNGIGIVSAWFRFDGWIPNSFDMDISIPGDSPIPFDFNQGGIIARGDGSGRLRLMQEDTVIMVSGDLVAQNSEISLSSDDADPVDNTDRPGNEGLTSIVDLTIRAGRKVEFFWPTFDFPIIQAHADLGAGLHIISDSSNGSFALTGDVRLRGGEIYYLERNFYIREATLFFRETEAGINPNISARAEIRDQGPEGPVTLSMVIDNAPLTSFEPRFESNPPLSQYEIYSILGQNLQDDPFRSRDVLISGSADALANFAVMRTIQRGARDFLGLDMFSVRTQVLQNMLFQFSGINSYLAGNSTGQDQANWNKVGTYFDKTTIFMGRYIGSDIFAQARFNFRYDEERQALGGLYFEPEIGLEMRNPLFDIQFNMAPQNSENLFIDSVSFTLSWRRTF